MVYVRIIEFVGKRLQKLNSVTQDVLKLAACIGNEFDLKTLAIVRQTSDVETATDLWQALKEGLILPTTEVYKFYAARSEEINLSQNGDNLSVSYKFLSDSCYDWAINPIWHLVHPELG